MATTSTNSIYCLTHNFALRPEKILSVVNTRAMFTVELTSGESECGVRWRAGAEAVMREVILTSSSDIILRMHH